MGVKKILILFVILVSLPLFASEHFETDDYFTVLEKINTLNKTAQPHEILVVFDIDNTLLKMNTNLGSEQWVDWQLEGMRKKAEDPNPGNKYDYVVASDREELLRIWGILLYLNSTSLTQENLPKVLGQLQNSSINAMVMTARGPMDHNYTLRELLRNSLDFTKKPLPPVKGYAGTFLPKLSDKDKQKLTKPLRPVQYNEGVYFTDGQHKGIMLKALLAKSRQKIKHIVFIDNLEIQTKRVQEAFKDSNVNVVTFRYSRMDAERESFFKADKTEVIKQWNLLKNTVKTIFGCVAAIDSVRVQTENY